MLAVKRNRPRRTVMSTVNVEILAQYIFLHISRTALDAQKFDVSKNYN